MKIKSFRIDGFRNLDDVTVHLGGITALVATNNYGKTNLIDGIEFGVNYINANKAQRSRMMSDEKLLPLNKVLEDRDFLFEIELEDAGLGKYKYMRYGFSFSWIKDDESGCRITNEILEMNDRASGRWASYIDRPSEKFRKSYNTRSMRSLALDDTTLAIDIIPSLKDIDISEPIKRLKELIVVMYRTLEAGDRFRPTPIEFADKIVPPDAIAFDDEDLPRSLFRFRQHNPEAYTEFLSNIYDLFPTFSNVSVDTFELKGDIYEMLNETLHRDDDSEKNGEVPFKIRNDQYRLSITDDTLNQPVDISLMSTGTKRIIWLVANTIISHYGKAHCLGIEEIEASVHPKMTKALLEVLDHYTRDAGLLVTSHSPYLIQYLKPQQIYIGIPNDAGVAKFAKIGESKLDLALTLAYKRGLGLGEYIFELLASEDGLHNTLAQLIGE